jgi:hypothetical protein
LLSFESGACKLKPANVDATWSSADARATAEECERPEFERAKCVITPLLRDRSHPSRVDYGFFEGRQVRGRVKKVFLRGAIWLWTASNGMGAKGWGKCSRAAAFRVLSRHRKRRRRR